MMTLIEAINTSLPFRRPADKTWFVVDKATGYIRHMGPDANVFEILPITLDNIRATDWEVDEPFISVTQSQFYNGVRAAVVEEMSERRLVYEPEQEFNRVVRQAVDRYWRHISGKTV